jgi:hypothetical protein
MITKVFALRRMNLGHYIMRTPQFIQAYLHRYCVLYKLKVCGNPASSKSIGDIFPTASAHFVSLCHGLVMLAIFQNFFFIIISVMVICDQ